MLAAAGTAYLGGMTVSDMLKEAKLDLPKVARLTGYSHSLLKQWSAGLRTPPPEAERRIAEAFRVHGRQLLAHADALHPPAAAPNPLTPCLAPERSHKTMGDSERIAELERALRDAHQMLVQAQAIYYKVRLQKIAAGTVWKRLNPIVWRISQALPALSPASRPPFSNEEQTRKGRDHGK